jgi:hypothetical protein
MDFFCEILLRNLFFVEYMHFFSIRIQRDRDGQNRLTKFASADLLFYSFEEIFIFFRAVYLKSLTKQFFSYFFLKGVN